MFQYAIAKAIAKRRGDKFKLDISSFTNQKIRKYGLNQFNIEENISSNNEVIKLAGKDNIFLKLRAKLGFQAIRPKTYFLEKETAYFHKEVFNYNNDIYLDGYWQNEKYFKDIRTEIIRDFTLKKDTNNKLKKYLRDIKSNQSVSLHVRRGDYLENIQINKVHGICKIDYYKKAIKRIKQHIESPIIYIFSDDIKWCKENFDFLENKFFVDNLNNAFDELELMKNCKHNIIANSTFSWWGAWLSKADSKIVIAPKVWWHNLPYKNIASPGWLLL